MSALSTLVSFIVFFLSFNTQAQNICEFKVDYQAGVGCSGEFVANSTSDLDTYAQDFGLDNGNYKALKINFSPNLQLLEVHSPCSIEFANNQSVTSDFICLDAREGFFSKNNLNITGGELNILSQNKGISLDQNSKVLSSTSINLQANGEILVGDNVELNSSGSINALSNGSGVTSNLILKQNSKVTAVDFSASIENKIEVGNNARLTLSGSLDFLTTANASTSNINFTQNSKVTAASLKAETKRQLLIGNGVELNIVGFAQFLSTGNSSNSEVRMTQNSKVNALNINFDALRKIDFDNGSQQIADNHLNVDGAICEISNNSTQTAPSITGSCFNNPNLAPVMIGDQTLDGERNTTISFTLNGATDANNDSLVYEIVTPPEFGTLENCLGRTSDLTCDYTPATDYSGIITFSYRASDGIIYSTSNSNVTLIYNTAPEMVADQNFTFNEDEVFTFTLNGATDIDNDPLTYLIVTPPSNGVLSDCLGGTSDLSCTFTPSANFNGSISFSYKANDGQIDSTTDSIVNFTVNPVNDAPVVGSNQSITTPEGIAVNFALNPGSDIENDSLTYFLETSPAHGTISGCLNNTGNLSCTYTPNDNDFNGGDTLTYRVKDGTLNSVSFATITFNITPVNDAPVMIGDQSLTKEEDESFAIVLLGATDVDLDNLTYSFISLPNHGSISGCLNNASSLVCNYTPEENYNGPVTFSYKANDGNLDSQNIAVVTINLTPVNDAPVMAANQSFTVSEDSVLTFTIDSASDVENDTLTYSIVDISDDPDAGVISGCLESNGDLTCTYTPAQNISGTFSFDYIANDGELNAKVKATINITVIPSNDAPEMIADQAFETKENTSIDFSLNGATDIDGIDVLNYFVLSGPSNGTLTNCIQNNSDLSCTYTPNNGFTGIDTFTYQANDGIDSSVNYSTVTISVLEVNFVPTFASTQSFETNEDIALDFSVAPALDEDNDSLTYTITAYPKHGTISGCLENNANLFCHYSPSSNFNGIDSFSYIANDGKSQSQNPAQVLINVIPINDRPEMINLTEVFHTNENSSVEISLSGGIDIDNDELVYLATNNTEHGTISNCLQGTKELTCTYIPNPGFSGNDSFTYIASDGAEFSLMESTVTLIVTGNDDAPLVGLNQSFNFNEDETFQFALNQGIDPEGNAVTYILTQSPATGTLVGCLDGTPFTNCTYVPEENFNGVITFSYKVNDGLLDSTNFAQVSLTIHPVNDAPELIAVQSFSLPFNGGNFGVAAASDVENDSLTYEITQNGIFGSVTNCLSNDGDLLCDYVPQTGFVGIDTFSYRTFDGDKHSIESVVTILVNPSNTEPVMLADETFEGEQDINLDFTLQGASDTEGNVLTYITVANPSNGTLTNCLNNSSILNCTYIPNPGFFGTDSFTYRASDGLSNSTSVSTVTLEIRKANANPVLGLNQSFETQKNLILNFTVNMANDSDNDPVTYFVVTSPSNGTLTNCLENNNDLTCIYTPNTDFVGNDSFTYRASDGIEESETTGTIFITVNEINNPPVMIGDQSISTIEGISIVFQLNGAEDVDGDALVYNILTQPQNGTLSGCAQNDNSLVCTYIPNESFNGTDSFAYVASDSKDSSPNASLVEIVVDSAPTGGNQITDLIVGGRSTCVRGTLNSNIICWGRNDSGQLGIDSTNFKLPYSNAEPIKISSQIKTLSKGSDFACAVLNNNSVKCWGENSFGQLGINSTQRVSDSNLRSILSSPLTNVGFDVEKISSGTFSSCALSVDGDVRCWGWNVGGQLGYPQISQSVNVGDGVGPSIISVGNVNIGEKIVDISVGNVVACAISETGNLYCWGQIYMYGNTTTRPGINMSPNQAGPIPIGGKVISVATGDSQVCALLENQNLRCFGLNTFGTLGDNSTRIIGDNELPSSTNPVDLGTSSSIQKVKIANITTCALVSDGNMKCWGYGFHGGTGQGNTNNLGTGSPLLSNIPFISMGEKVVDFDASSGGAHFCSILESGKVKCWGYEDFTGSFLGIAGNTAKIGDDEIPSSVGNTEILGFEQSNSLVAFFETDIFNYEVNKSIGFSASSSISTLPINNYEWNFDDGSTSTGVTTSHTFTSTGIFQVNLKITDSDGNESEFNKEIIVGTENLSPVANIVSNIDLITDSGVVDFNGSLSNDPDGAISSYSWQFGDGSSGSGERTSHAFLQPGEYTVQLLVTDNRGSQDISTKTIIVNEAPKSSFIASISDGVAPLSVNFDANSSFDNDDGIISYSWQFGDGNLATGVQAYNEYLLPGTYLVTLTVEDSRGAIDASNFEIVVEASGTPPNAQISLSSPSINQGEFVAFNGSLSSDSDGDIRFYRWSFGDGSNATGLAVSHVFSQAGVYNVTLEVEDFQGSISTSSALVSVNSKPTASFSFNPLTGDFPLLVNFDASASSDLEGAIASYSWSLGDRTNAIGVNPSHTYTTEGTFIIELTVTDSNGATNKLQKTIVVTKPNTPPIANFDYNSTEGNYSSVVQFNASSSSDSDGVIVSYEWLFPDSSTASGITVTKEFFSNITSPVQLTITDNRGAVVSISKTVDFFVPKVVVAIEKPQVAFFVGDVVTLDSRVYKRNGETLVNKELTWSSSDENVIVVNNGTFTALDVGAVTITATHISGASNSFDVEVREPSTNLVTNFKTNSFVSESLSDLRGKLPSSSAGKRVFSQFSNEEFSSNSSTGGFNITIPLIVGDNNVILSVKGSNLPPVNQSIKFFDGIGDSLRFDDGDFITLSNVSNLLNDSFTMSFWLRGKGAGELIEFPHASGSHTLSMNSNNTLKLVVDTDNGPFTVATAKAKSTDWRKIAIVYDKTSKVLTLYENGQKASETIVQGIINPLISSIKIGGKLTGHFDEPRLWARVLNTTELQVDLFADATNAPSNALAFFSFENLSGQTEKSSLGGDELIVMGPTTAFEDGDPTRKKKSKLLITQSIEGDVVNLVKADNAVLKIQENLFDVNFEIDIAKESSNTTQRLPSELEMVGDIYRIRANERLTFSDNAQLSLKISEDIDTDNVIVMNSSFGKRLSIIDSKNLKFEKGKVSFPVYSFGDYFVVMKNSVSSVVEFSSPQFTEYGLPLNLLRVMGARGSFGSQQTVDGILENFFFSAIYCNGQWLSTIPDDFPITLPLNPGMNECGVFTRFNYESLPGYFLETPTLLRINNI